MTFFKKIFSKRFLLKALALSVTALLTATAMLYIFIPYDRDIFSGIQKSQTILDRNGNALRCFLTEGDEWCFYVKLGEMNSYLKNAVIAAEDKRFYGHPGVDVAAVLRAAYLDATRMKIVSGASTIPMQVVKLLEQNERRDITNKVSEAVKALKLSSDVEKDFVLELYLNIAPFGKNIRGVEAASLYYFGRHSSDLSPGEAALLAGLPKAPSYLRPDRHPERAIERRNFVLQKMLEFKMITPEQYTEALHETPDIKAQSVPFLAPHFTDFVRGLYPHEKTVITTLDPRMQEILRNIIEDAVVENSGYGITNGAGVIIENTTGAVRAYVGSADFFSRENSGQIDGVRMKRPPGSALKPFIYSIGMENGIFTPAYVFYDIPSDFAGYAPVNYDGDFSGPVTLQEALNKSLNIPAVDALRRTGVENAIDFLRKCGVSGINHSAGYYGLSFALGSAEISLLELTNAYAVPANRGKYIPYNCLESGKPGHGARQAYSGKQVLSEETAYIISCLLSDEEKLPAPMKVRGGREIYPKIAWKTGTSYGNKDAWCAGYNPDFTIGIWYGNFSGKGSPELSGMRTAAPSIFKAFAEIYANKDIPEWYGKPDNVKTRGVCALSGKVPGKFCKNITEELYIQGVSSEEPCAIEKEALVDIDSGYEVCAACAGESETEKRVYLNYASGAAEFLSSTGTIDSRRLMPQHNPACPVANKMEPLKIISPRDAGRFAVLKGAAQETQAIALKARKGGLQNVKIYWFIDSEFFQESAVNQYLLWSPVPGRHSITCTDEFGNSSSVNVEVE